MQTLRHSKITLIEVFNFETTYQSSPKLQVSIFYIQRNVSFYLQIEFVAIQVHFEGSMLQKTRLARLPPRDHSSRSHRNQSL